MPERNLRGGAGLDEAGRRRRLTFLGFGLDDEANIREIGAFARAHAEEIIDELFAHLSNFTEIRTLLEAGVDIARLKRVLRTYFLQMIEARPDAEYFESRLRVGDAHQRIDLPPHWYLASYNVYLQLIGKRLRQHYRDNPARVLDLISSLSKLAALDTGLAVEAYIMGGYVDRGRAQEYQRMAEVADRTLREKEALEQVKADLTNMIVHDLKGPLGGILTVTQLALRKRGSPPDPHARHFEQIQRSARDLLRMIENLLAIDQMEEGRLQLRLEAVDVRELLTECANEFRPAAEMAGQRLHVTVDDDVPVLATDRWLVRRVMNNIVVNAIRHSGAVGRIDLEAHYSRGTVCIRVRDHGRGISSEDQAHLFAKHPRRSRSQSREDTGLGLVFCKMAVELCGGTIAVDSTSGAGTTFLVTLPVAIESE